MSLPICFGDESKSINAESPILIVKIKVNNDHQSDHSIKMIVFVKSKTIKAKDAEQQTNGLFRKRLDVNMQEIY